MSETARESFLRNHQENVRIMRASARSAELEGDLEEATQIREIADAWDRIAAKAEASGE